MKVTLIGAGPGDAELMTIKGWNRLKQADVVLYDRLVGEDIISMIPETVEKICVGKHAGKHPVSQEEIGSLLISKAKQGLNVVRLKGGDPFVFGRGGEELEILYENNIPFEVIPGVSSSIAAGVYAGIPLTHRDYSSSLHILTGHVKKNGQLDIDFKALAGFNGTLIILMGIAALENICTGFLEAGMDRQTPAAIIENATLKTQRKFIGTLETLFELSKQNNLVAPSVVIIGAVCALSEKLSTPLHRN
ncbi:MAG: uroporphyrinogen-III C-methyltransferase [Planctomycetaceae bacterium]|jgi:uroporphyrinogen III methyltransferase/synthase|nr:uroporphyrinogen-III C-methyltransferase [Planctomycetaceae bacterium]